ncbi:GNAT family N-acetyltransferase [Endozoicomonas sp. SCSIO W0465]|uniref:GNAT family N-acetyltransferase n=1 Tax=Endozoicomonas sp. SCSIO W0465 TaxID=2918516 RepID=UPI0020758205|nr:GNAT family N-acetyltransferase [Endozoicomonas sp. SCSIO W0465]USE39515.1 GNAT family N-acetyltransferase [Endozoicomonas sp. SCSIO W0465]
MEITIKQIQEFRPSGCSLIAYDKEGNRLGHAYISLDGDVATLVDIYVRPDTKKRTLLPFLNRKATFRNRGIGSKLLQHVIALCEATNVTALKGRMEGDISRLELWYAKYGFIISGTDITLTFSE